MAGEIANRAKLGGPDLRMTVHSRNRNSGACMTFVATFLEHYGREMSPNVKKLTGNAQLTKAVFNDPSGIGGAGFAEERDSRPVKIVADRGIMSQPSSFGAKTGGYPPQRATCIYTGLPEELPPLATALVNSSISDAVIPLRRLDRFGRVGRGEPQAARGACPVHAGRIEGTDGSGPDLRQGAQARSTRSAAPPTLPGSA